MTDPDIVLDPDTLADLDALADKAVIHDADVVSIRTDTFITLLAAYAAYHQEIPA